MSECISNIWHQSQVFHVDRCANTISLEIRDEVKFTKTSLISLSKDCYDAYLYHLLPFSKEIQKIGESEYMLINEALIDLILPYNPLKFSFSMTPDPSLHFLVRFSGNFSIFIEVFLDIEEGNDTYIQISKNNHNILEANLKFDDAIQSITKELDAQNANAPLIYYNIEKDFDKCQPFPHDLLQMSKR